MCSNLLIDGKEIDCIRDLTATLGFVPPSYDGDPYTGEETYCLCGVDWPALAKKLGRRIELDSDCIDYIAHPPESTHPLSAVNA